ncbi:uncharacterized protein LOC129233902 [Uloborus diversus]|uniref:uncharacterized protein LOC129233902 n=1 Tax=Uloborus diversus TaxID=327109 RepID=UPI002408F7A2|nr:uncharacterized protein LOC129233902 [Uloborus diversus]
MSSEFPHMLLDSKSPKKSQERNEKETKITSVKKQEKIRIQSLVQRQKNIINQHVNRRNEEERHVFPTTEENEKHFDSEKEKKLIRVSQIWRDNKKWEKLFKRELRTLKEMEQFLEYLREKDLQKHSYKCKKMIKELPNPFVDKKEKSLSATENCGHLISDSAQKREIQNKIKRKTFFEKSDEGSEPTSKGFSKFRSIARQENKQKERHKKVSKQGKCIPNLKKNEEEKKCHLQEQNKHRIYNNKSEQSVESIPLNSYYKLKSKRQFTAEKHKISKEFHNWKQEKKNSEWDKINYANKLANGKMYEIRMARSDINMASTLDQNTHRCTLPRGLNLKSMFILGDKKLGLFKNKFLLKVKGNQIYLESAETKPKHKLTKGKQNRNSMVNRSQLKSFFIKASAGTNSKETGGEFHCFSGGGKNEETTLEEMESFLRQLRLKKKTTSTSQSSRFDSKSHASEVTDRARDERRAKLLSCMHDSPKKTARLLEDLKRHGRQSDDNFATESKKQKLLRKMREETDAIISEGNSHLRRGAGLNTENGEIPEVTNAREDCKQNEKFDVSFKIKKLEQEKNDVTQCENNQNCAKTSSELRILNVLRAKRKDAKMKKKTIINNE